MQVTLTLVTKDNARQIFGHAVTAPHPDAVQFVSKLIANAPLIPEPQLIGLAIPLLANLRGELSEPSYRAVSVLLGSVMKQAYLREQGMVEVSPNNPLKAPPGFVRAADLYGILPGFRDAMPDDPALGTPDCPCLKCSLQRARGETPAPGATVH